MTVKSVLETAKLTDLMCRSTSVMAADQAAMVNTDGQMSGEP